jgi:hypothetical protein
MPVEIRRLGPGDEDAVVAARALFDRDNRAARATYISAGADMAGLHVSVDWNLRAGARRDDEPA